ncbi:hypothetical protein IP69_13780 [Bosea sp. AAP35]|nr:hypothetical protein IP69_13780 [Bosea sp. AAP35]
MSLGCIDCPELGICGGQTIDGAGFNCLDHCCGKSDSCQAVCPNAQRFADRIREVGGLDLETPQIAPLRPLVLPSYLPMLFHGSALVKTITIPAVAIPLYRFFDQAAGCRFNTRESICQSYKIDSRTDIVLSGVAQDHEVEGWWKLEAPGRIKAIANLRSLGIAMVTTPNFSLMVDRPRWDDLHSMRRIVLSYHELVSEGQAAALHVNGRTRQDFLRWTEYVAAHGEVTHIAYEFTTGTKNPLRMRQHAQWLVELAQACGRRLGLVLRGGTQVVGLLSNFYDISVIDSSPFEKAQHREVAWIDHEEQRRWKKRLTAPGEPVDALLDENIRISERWFGTSLRKFKLAA